MKAFLTAVTALSATAAAAHPGHVAPEAGHSHGEVIALVAVVVLAIGAFVWMTRRG